MSGTFIEAVLLEYAKADEFEGLFWRPANVDQSGHDDGAVRLYALCNDVFWWATADCEVIESDNDLAILRSCREDLGEAGFYLSELYAARKRGMRPQRPWLDRLDANEYDQHALPLFLAAGPERTREDEGLLSVSRWSGIHVNSKNYATRSRGLIRTLG